MRSPFRRSTLTLGLIALVAACAPDDTEQADATPQDPPAPTEEQALDALRDTWVENYNAGRADAVAALYADSAWTLNADMSVDEGREAIAASHAEAIAGSPTATVNTSERMVLGDHAVALGGYEVDATMEGGEAMGWSGTWLGYFRKVGGEWKIAGMLTNYGAPPAEGMAWAEPPAETPPENSAMNDLIAQYEAAFNAQDGAAIAALHHDDARVAYSFGPVMSGGQAVADELAARWAERATSIDVHGVDSIELDGTHMLDGGWYELTDAASGEEVQTGMYLSLVERAADGSWKILWSVTNGRPADGAMAASGAGS